MQESEIYNHSEIIEQYNFTRERDSRIQNLSLEWVPFDKLFVTRSQVDSFDPDHVREILSEYHPAIVRSSSVALIGDVYVLWEGQHSATVNWLKGMDKIPCMVYKTNDLSFKNVPSIEKFDSGQLADLMVDLVNKNNLTSIEELLSLIKIPDNYEKR